MTEADLANKLLAHLRLVPNATPTKLLAEFRRLGAVDSYRSHKTMAANVTTAR